MIGVLLLAAAQAAAPPPPPAPVMTPPLERDVMAAQFRAPPSAAPPKGLSEPEAQRVYRVYLEGRAAPPAPTGASLAGPASAGPGR